MTKTCSWRGRLRLEAKLGALEEQKTELEAANDSSAQQLTVLEERVKKAASEIATLSAEKTNLEQTLEETTTKLRAELELVTAHAEALQTQLAQTRERCRQLCQSFKNACRSTRWLARRLLESSRIRRQK
jgi:chromosome segregation ATPase